MTVGHTSKLCGRNTNFSNFSKIKLSQVLWLMTPSWRNISSNHLSKSNNFLCCLSSSFYPSLSSLASASIHCLRNFSSLNTNSFGDQINKLWNFGWEKHFLLGQLKLSIENFLWARRRNWMPGLFKQEQINPIIERFLAGFQFQLNETSFPSSSMMSPSITVSVDNQGEWQGS